MKEEEKLLLLEDISARLPFGLAFITKQVKMIGDFRQAKR